MTDYYAENLSGERLRHCYDVAPPRVRQYLDAEIEHVLSKICLGDAVLELGCGYGRVLGRLVGKALLTVGIDVSVPSLTTAEEALRGYPHAFVAAMDAVALGLPDAAFDVVVCIQNGICAFGVNPLHLIREAVRVTRPGGSVLLSSYAESFWEERLEWFELQAAFGLIGEIDPVRTKNGVIVCQDGFRAGTFRREDFDELATSLDFLPIIQEVDESSLFCELRVGAPPFPREGD
ncbi:MAG TPA: class I SAM-dependent methyltransferase [Phycisphaerae bacterium]|nr:class I SAM-dependent methyltransferase [Phycisphaerae bacterium]